MTRYIMIGIVKLPRRTRKKKPFLRPLAMLAVKKVVWCKAKNISGSAKTQQYPEKS